MNVRSRLLSLNKKQITNTNMKTLKFLIKTSFFNKILKRKKTVARSPKPKSRGRRMLAQAHDKILMASCTTCS